MSEPLLVAEKLAVVYHHAITAIQGVSLTVHEGQIVAILGTNGAGKSTTLRALSGFHLLLPPLAIWILLRQGYDSRAAWMQTLVVWATLPITWLLTTPDDNVNWVHGFGEAAEQPLPPLLYLFLYMALFPVLVILPAHMALTRLFPRPEEPT